MKEYSINEALRELRAPSKQKSLGESGTSGRTLLKESITWNSADEARYDLEGPNDDPQDLAAYIAYVIAEDGHTLQEFVKEGPDGEWFIRVDDDETPHWYQYVGQEGLINIDDEMR